MGDDIVETEAFCFGIDKVVFVSIEDLPLDAPVVIDEVWIIEVDAPTFALWWKTAEEEHSCVLRQEWNKGVILHLRCASCDIIYVQICHDCYTFCLQR